MSTYTILQIFSQKNLQIDSCDDIKDQDTSPKREMSFPENILRTTFNYALAVCAVAPSCLTLHIPWFCPFSAIWTISSKKYGPEMQVGLIANDTVSLSK